MTYFAATPASPLSPTPLSPYTYDTAIGFASATPAGVYAPTSFVAAAPAVMVPHGVNLLTIGPIIGLVTASTARIMIETPIGGLVTGTVTAHTTQQSFRAQVMAQPNRPAMLVFTGLPSGMRFIVRIEGYEHCPSSFKTFSPFPTVDEGLCFAAASCNKIRITQTQVTPHEDVWRGLAHEVLAGKIDMMIHLGDQIYADDDMGKVEKGKKTLEEVLPYSVFAQGYKMAIQTPPSRWDSIRPQIIERFRQVYRDTWSHPPTRTVLANVPNLMIYDDHDIRDDLGDKPEHLTPGPIRLVIECGRKACIEYQRQLLSNVEVGDEYNAPPLAIENHFLGHWGQYGVMMLDSRGSKTFQQMPGDPRPYLGSAQWQQIYETLRAGGEFERVKTLIVGTQIPLFFFNRDLTERVAKKGDDFEGHWGYKANQAEMYELLGLLRGWMSRDPERRIVLVGGDMHIGGYSNVFFGRKFFCQQILVGPISNVPPRAPMMVGTGIVNAFNSSHGDNWSADHFGWFSARNVGLIKTTPQVGRVAVGHLMTSGSKVKLHWATLHREQVKNRPRSLSTSAVSKSPRRPRQAEGTVYAPFSPYQSTPQPLYGKGYGVASPATPTPVQWL